MFLQYTSIDAFSFQVANSATLLADLEAMMRLAWRGMRSVAMRPVTTAWAAFIEVVYRAGNSAFGHRPWISQGLRRDDG